MAIQEFTGELEAPLEPQQAPKFVSYTGEVETEKSKTSNPLMGLVSRGSEMLGSGAQALRRVSEPTATGIQQALPESMRSKYLAPEAVTARQEELTAAANKYSKDIGYAPSTTLAELGDNPLKVIPFVAERVITSSPDMAAAAFAFTPYVMTRSNEILNERLKNDNKTYADATVGDVAAATTAAIGEATLERFATKRILPGGKGIAAAPATGVAAAGKRIGKEVGLQGGTESLEELSSYGGETIGTEKGFQPGEAGERMLEAGIVGAGLGGGARGAREVYDARRAEKVEPYSGEVEPAAEPVMTKGERKDFEQAQDRARAEQEVIPVPASEAQDTQAMMDELLGEKPKAEVKRDVGTIAGQDIVETPVAELKLSADVPQFKEAADEFGVVEPLKGQKYERTGTAPIQVWRRLNGDLEVISGRHRFDLARRTGEKTIPAQVFNEADGFNADMAAIMDAELNIRDEKGTVSDYVNYFTETGKQGLTEKDYESRGLLDGKTGRRAYTVATQGSDELIQALRGQQVSEESAYQIANAAPNDARLQALGIKLVNEKPIAQAVNILKAAKTIEPKAPEMGGDLFGFDDSGLKLAEDMGRLASEKQRAISADIGTIERAGKNPTIAKKYGIDVKDPASIKEKVKELKALRAAWDNWASDPALVELIRREISGEAPVVVDTKAPRKNVVKDENSPINKAAQTSRMQADAFGLTSRIEEMFANRMSIDEITAALDADLYFIEPIARKSWVIQVGVTLGVPGGIGKNDQAEFDKWVSDYYKRVGREVKEKPAETKVKPAETKPAVSNWPKDIPTEIYRGYGRESKAAVYGATAYPVAGKAKYYALSKEAASEFGPNTEKSISPLSNPYVIRDGNQWKKLTKKAGWDFPNQSLSPEAIVEKLTANLQDMLKQEGYDGIIAYWDETSPYDVGPKGENYKLLNSVFGIPQVIVFEKELELAPTVEKTPAGKKAEAAEAEVRELKAIADREREVFDLTPKSPDTGTDPAVQQDMLGASGMTEQEFKKGIDKNSTEPGEPLVLRDVTMNEKQYYNDTANKKVDEEQIGWFNNIEAAKKVEQKFDNKTVDVGDKGLYDTVEKQAKAIEDAVASSKDHKFTAKEFHEIAKSELDKGNISPEVFAAIEDAYKKHPGILEGIALQVGERGQPNVLGQFQPIARMVKLFKDTSGVMDPSTVRHEIAHAMEQMMTSKQKLAIVGEWRKALANAMRADKTKEGAKFFAAVSEFLHAPSLETLRAAQNAMPNDSYYQYINPSEYWAVNAEELLKAQLGGGWGKFKVNINGLYDSLKNSFGMSNFWVGNNVFKQILEGDRMSSKMLLNYIFKTKRRNYKGDPAPMASWVSRPTDWLEDKKYKYVDKYVDLLRATTDIQEKSGEISDMLNAYQKETLSHGRMSKAMKDFLNQEGRPLAEVMQKYNITQPQMHDYLVARHAEERNKQIAKINPEMQDGGSGMTYAEIKDYMSKISPERLKQFDEAAKIVDQMVRGTQDLLVDSGLETQDTIDAWNNTYDFYVPLYRKDLDYTRAGRGSGRGYTSRGSFSKRATGSMKDVEDVLESIAVERIRAIERAEKSRVGRALYAMSIGHPNPDFWLAINRDAIKSKEKTKAELRKLGLDDDAIDNIMEQPKSPKIDQETGLVYYAPDTYTLNSPNVFSVRIDGKDRFIIFNSSDPRASRLASAMQNMDMPEIEGMLRSFAYVTRWLSSVNTQYNPIFGAYNFIRDVQGAALNLSSTELRGSEWEVTNPKRLGSIIKGIYADLRSERKTGKVAEGKWSDLWEDFQKHGGQTGYKSQFVQPKDDAKLVAEAIGNLNKGNVRKTVDGIMGWLSDYNDSMENAVRLSAYEVALSKGMSKDKAASLAKNLTVNFNRKGANSSLAGSLFAFFNASVQGTARLYETLKGPNGKKIMYGGLALGAIQAVVIAAAGFEDDEPPEFVKEKSIIIPVGGKKYLSIPMPLGFNVIPGLGRIMMEGAMNPDKASDKFFSLLSLIANSFNPLGSSGLTLQTLAPTALDPFVSLATNKDSFGKPIYRKDRETNPQVGYERTRDNTSAFWKELAMYVNYLTGGTEFTKGMWSPTGDEISYLVQQAGGGLAREVGKIYGGATDLAEGNEIAPYKIPIVGKLYGDAESKANVGNRFYRNVTQLAEVEREIAGRKKAGKDVSEIYAAHPEASLISQANRIENEVSQINKRKRVMVEKGATMEQLKQLEGLKERKMRQLNERYAKIK